MLEAMQGHPVRVSTARYEEQQGQERAGGGRYYGRYYEMGSCEALGRAVRAAAHPATTQLSVREAEAAGGRPRRAFLLRRRGVCCEDTLNLFRRYYTLNYA